MKAVIDIESIAAICHEANRAYCRTIGDMSQPDWHHAPAWQQDSARKGVEFHLANPDAGDSASHDNWMKQKIEEGWVYGEEKNPEAKTHPCIVPFDKLPLAQQLKDCLFRGIVHSLCLPEAQACACTVAHDGPCPDVEVAGTPA